MSGSLQTQWATNPRRYPLFCSLATASLPSDWEARESFFVIFDFCFWFILHLRDSFITYKYTLNNGPDGLVADLRVLQMHRDYSLVEVAESVMVSGPNRGLLAVEYHVLVVLSVVFGPLDVVLSQHLASVREIRPSLDHSLRHLDVFARMNVGHPNGSPEHELDLVVVRNPEPLVVLAQRRPVLVQVEVNVSARLAEGLGERARWTQEQNVCHEAADGLAKEASASLLEFILAYTC